MRPIVRAALTVGAVLAAVVVAVVVRSLNDYGVFTDLTPGFAGTCVTIPNIHGPEDIAIDAPSGWAFISAMDRYAFNAGKPSPQDGLYALRVGSSPPAVSKLTGVPKDFHPHGISLVRGGGLALLVINHRSDHTNSIEIFDVAADKSGVVLHHTGSIASGALTTPNAIAAVDPDHFYVVNDHGSAAAFGRMLEDYLVLPRANLLYFDGMEFRVMVQHLAYPSGLALSADGHYLYATEINTRRIDTFERQPLSGSLDQVGTLDVPSGVDNLRFDTEGHLWVGSHPKGFAMDAFRSDPTKPAPSEIFKVMLVNGIPKSAVPVFTDLGKRIGGSSVGAVSGQALLIGSPLDDHVLDCRMAH